jgi:hypothetical protein
MLAPEKVAVVRKALLFTKLDGSTLELPVGTELVIHSLYEGRVN